MTIWLRSVAVKLPLVLVAAWLTAGCDVTVNGLSGDRYVERQKKDFQVSDTPDIVLATFDGSIEVRVWDRSEVSVEIEKRGPNKDAIDRMQVTATQSGNRISVEVKNPDERRGHIGFSVARTARLIASVPRRANVEARSGDGSVSIERVTGRINVDTGDGSVKLVDITGDVRAHTGDGTMSIEGIDGRVDADTGDGTIAVSGKMEVLRLETGDGSVNIRATNGSRMADAWDVRTGDGTVRVELPEAFDADLDVHTNDGSVLLHELTVKGQISKKTVRGQLGAGGKTLRINSGDGTISIERS